MYAGQANIAKINDPIAAAVRRRTYRTYSDVVHVRTSDGGQLRAAICFGKRVINATFQLSLWIL